MHFYPFIGRKKNGIVIYVYLKYYKVNWDSMGVDTMICSIQTLGVSGIRGNSVLSECYISNGLPGFDIVGLPDAEIWHQGKTEKRIVFCGIMQYYVFDKA